MRFTEFVSGVKITDISARETMLGNDHENSDCRRAVVFSMTLENGGVASGIANYCGPCAPYWNHWGYEYVRVFGENATIRMFSLPLLGRGSLCSAERSMRRSRLLTRL